MNINDIVRSSKVRPNETAKITRVDICKKLNEKGKIETRTKYEALYSDGTKLTFIGAQCNKSVFKVLEKDNQITLNDYFHYIKE